MVGRHSSVAQALKAQERRHKWLLDFVPEVAVALNYFNAVIEAGLAAAARAVKHQHAQHAQQPHPTGDQRVRKLLRRCAHVADL